MTTTQYDSIAVIDYGSQTAQLIVRRVRELGVHSVLVPFDVSSRELKALKPKGIILSGGPESVNRSSSPKLPNAVLEMKVPVLGICYGMQLLSHSLGGRISPASGREFGDATLTLRANGHIPLLKGMTSSTTVWMSHGDRVESLPSGFEVLGRTESVPIAVIGDSERNLFAVMFHPEVTHSSEGLVLLRNFVIDICGCRSNWTPGTFVGMAVHEIRQCVGKKRVLMAVSGGVDSSVMAALIFRAIGSQAQAIFVDHGLLREGELAETRSLLHSLGIPVHVVSAGDRFLERLANVDDPEQKRIIIGETFVRVFEHEAATLGNFDFLAQGTLYPDIIESAGSSTSAAHKIKTHHNVGGLPSEMTFEVLEPLRELYKDEVRAVGREMGLPVAVVERSPFPGPGLAVRIIGTVTPEKLSTLRKADAIVRAEIEGARELLGSNFPWQYFAVLLPIHTVGVMGDQRTYGSVISIRAVTSEDGMTANWAQLPASLITRIATRIVNEVHGINRVVYDVTSKPPATIEWE